MAALKYGARVTNQRQTPGTTLGAFPAPLSGAQFNLHSKLGLGISPMTTPRGSGCLPHQSGDLPG